MCIDYIVVVCRIYSFISESVVCRPAENLFIFYVLFIFIAIYWIELCDGERTGKWTTGEKQRMRRRLKCCKIKGNLICIYTELDFHVQIDIKNSTEYSNSAQRKREKLKHWKTGTTEQNCKMKKKIYRKLNYMRQQSWQNMYFHFSHEIISIKRVFFQLSTSLKFH